MRQSQELTCTSLGHQVSYNLFQGYCYALSPADIAAFPTVSITLGDGDNAIKLEMEPSIYLRQGSSFCDDKSQYGLGFDKGPVTDGTILGDTFMEGFTTIFDREAGRVGFVPTNAEDCK